ncbi:hypothetical protein GGX14DRAFT_569015 [Mycena pura]|uniref:Uncharacterized protein n=1 Tax=Mycena pura TaxID=153505 RepID=A0AAD6V816_9AGAR|nr:hypothetical protein GGX14DRAFT_569015 [Mycena pura]
MYACLAFIIGHLVLGALLLSVPHAPATGASEPFPLTEVLLVVGTIVSLVSSTVCMLVNEVVSDRALVVICNWVVVQCLCVREGLFALDIITPVLFPVISYAVLTVAVEYTYLAMQGQRTNRIQELMLAPSRHILDGFLFRLYAMVGLDYVAVMQDMSTAATSSGQGAVVGSGQGATGGDSRDAVGGGQRATRGDTVGSGEGETGSSTGSGGASTSNSTLPPPYASVPTSNHHQPLQASEKVSDLSLV